MTRRGAALAVAFGLGLPVAARGQQLPPGSPAASPPAAAQNPSPMVEATRRHERLPADTPPGTRRTFAGPLGKPVAVFVPARTRRADRLHLVVHFHGGALVPEIAAAGVGGDAVLAAVQLGAGSGVYDRAFAEPAAFDSLVAGVVREVAAALGAPVHDVRVRRVTLAGFSAGHGAVRAILRDSTHLCGVDAVLLLDGMHTSYVPDRTPLADGGALDPRPIAELERFAELAARGEKRMLVTHSEIFPGTFASTTETADHLLRSLGLPRTPVLRWGPRGMQQLGEARRGRLEVLSFAGNSAPDHIDHFQSMPEMLRRLWR